MAEIATAADPFNWPMPKRADLMSLSSLGQRDVPRVKTANYTRRVRDQSQNLDTLDIKGSLYTFEIFRGTTKKDDQGGEQA